MSLGYRLKFDHHDLLDFKRLVKMSSLFSNGGILTFPFIFEFFVMANVKSVSSQR